MLKAVIFDLDGTLLDRNATIETFLPDQFARKISTNTRISFDTFRKRFLQLDNFGYKPRLTVYEALVSEFGLDIPPQDLVDDHRAHFGLHSVMFPGAECLLNDLRKAGYRLGIITNGSSDSQRLKMRSTGLEQLMDTILVSEEIGIAKPNTAIFQLAADQLNVKIDECIFIGDHPTNDVIGACSAGMISVWFKGDLPWPSDSRVKPDFIISTLDELRKIITAV